MLCEKSLRRKADRIGYSLEKGYQRYMYNGAVFRDRYGRPTTGYNVIDLSTGNYVPSCYNNVFDHLFTQEDVYNFLKEEYREQGLQF